MNAAFTVQRQTGDPASLADVFLHFLQLCFVIL